MMVLCLRERDVEKCQKEFEMAYQLVVRHLEIYTLLQLLCSFLSCVYISVMSFCFLKQRLGEEREREREKREGGRFGD